MIKNILKDKEDTYELVWFGSTDFSKLNPVKQVYGVLFNKKGEIVIVNTSGNWQLPGGKPEDNESFEETLIREVDEEVDVDISDIKPLGYQKVIHYEKDKRVSVTYQLRYFALVKKVKKQTIDPAHNKIPVRKFINPDEFLNYCPWSDIGKAIIKKAKNQFQNI